MFDLRRRLNLVFTFAIVAVIATVLANRGVSEIRARWNGFANAHEWKSAAAAGVSDPLTWQARQSSEADRQQRLAEAEQAEAARKIEECPKDLQCWADKNETAATVACRKEIQRLAKWQSEWTDGWTAPMFKQIAWADKKHARILYRGDRIKFQNGFGAWQNHVYDCIFDPAGEYVWAVQSRPGMLN